MDDRKLLETALKARENAYTPYSHFAVGAALLCKDGTVFTGCNIENAAFGPTICAERTAIFKAVSEGQRTFAAIAITGAPEGQQPDKICAPCGVCRQVMAEFCDPDTFRILLTDGKEIKSFLLKELLPLGFGKDNLDS